jgi:hypothetical protein
METDDGTLFTHRENPDAYAWADALFRVFSGRNGTYARAT